LSRSLRTVGATVAVATLGLSCLTGCSSGPSTKEEVCTAFDDLGKQVLQGNGVFGNLVFHKADTLSDVAKRYPDRDLSRDAKALKDIADSSSTSGAEIMAATSRIANVCGHPLMFGSLFGS
jgi:hypothetical protein